MLGQHIKFTCFCAVWTLDQLVFGWTKLFWFGSNVVRSPEKWHIARVCLTFLSSCRKDTQVLLYYKETVDTVYSYPETTACLFSILPFSFLLGRKKKCWHKCEGGNEIKRPYSGRPSCLFDSCCEKLNHRETHKSWGHRKQAGTVKSTPLQSTFHLSKQSKGICRVGQYKLKCVATRHLCSYANGCSVQPSYSR